MKVAFLAGIALATPVLFYEFWMFVSPGLYREEKISPAHNHSIAYFLYCRCLIRVFYCFSIRVRVFSGLYHGTIQAMPSMKEHLSLASQMLLAFGFVFELPLVMTFLSRMGLLPRFFKKQEICHTSVFCGSSNPYPRMWLARL